jgi:hypothetical protein
MQKESAATTAIDAGGMNLIHKILIGYFRGDHNYILLRLCAFVPLWLVQLTLPQKHNSLQLARIKELSAITF